MPDSKRLTLRAAAATGPDDPIWDVTAMPKPAEPAEGEVETAVPDDPIWDVTAPAQPAGEPGEQSAPTKTPDDPSTT